MEKALVENDQVKEEWRKYMKRLLNENNTWGQWHNLWKVEGPCELIRRDEIAKAQRMIMQKTAHSLSTFA